MKLDGKTLVFILDLLKKEQEKVILGMNEAESEQALALKQALSSTYFGLEIATDLIREKIYEIEDDGEKANG